MPKSIRKVLGGLFVLALTALLGGCLSLSAADRQVLWGASLKLADFPGERTYRQVLPDQDPVRIVVMLHAFGGSGRRIAYLSAVHNAFDGDTVVLYPDASIPTRPDVEPGWNAGYCCGSGWVEGIDDLAFLRELIERKCAEFDVPASRVYWAGFSNGAMMAMRFAAEHPEWCAGVIAASGSVGTQTGQLAPTTPVPIYLMHGEQDVLVPYQGGPGSTDKTIVWQGFEQTRALWEQRNGREVLTRVETFPNDGHRWHDWRLTRFWNRRPAASQRLADFIFEIEGANR